MKLKSFIITQGEAKVKHTNSYTVPYNTLYYKCIVLYYNYTVRSMATNWPLQNNKTVTVPKEGTIELSQHVRVHSVQQGIFSLGNGFFIF